MAERGGDGITLARMSLDRRSSGDALVRVLASLTECGELPEREASDGEVKNICPRCGAAMSGNPPRCSRCARPTSIMHRFLALMKRYRARMALIVLFMVISSALGVLTPYITSGFYVDEVLTEGGSFFGAIGLVLLLSVGTKLLSTVNSIVSGLVSCKMSADFIYELKKEVFSSFERLSVAFFTGRQTGGLMQMVDGDTGTIYWLFGDGLPYLLVNLAQVFVIFIIMLCISVPLTLLTVAVIPVAVLLWRLAYSKMRSYNARRFSADRTLKALLSGGEYPLRGPKSGSGGCRSACIGVLLCRVSACDGDTFAQRCGGMGGRRTVRYARGAFLRSVLYIHYLCRNGPRTYPVFLQHDIRNVRLTQCNVSHYRYS